MRKYPRTPFTGVRKLEELKGGLLHQWFNPGGVEFSLKKRSARAGQEMILAKRTLVEGASSAKIAGHLQNGSCLTIEYRLPLKRRTRKTNLRRLRVTFTGPLGGKGAGGGETKGGVDLRKGYVQSGREGGGPLTGSRVKRHVSGMWGETPVRTTRNSRRRPRQSVATIVLRIR